MPTPTNKDLLKQISCQQLATATQLSSFMNSTKDYISKQNSFNERTNSFNERIAGYLENDDKTNQVGVVQKQADLEEKLDKLVTQKNIAIGVSVFIAGAIAWLGNVFK